MNKSTRFLVMVSVMAALCFVGTYFLRIEIPTPLGRSMIHLGDVFCLLAAMLFGPMIGGLSGAVGMTIFDMLGGYMTTSPFTFVFKFVEGFTCGAIVWAGNSRSSGSYKAPGTVRSAIGCAAATAAYIVLYLARTFIEKRFVLKAELGTVLTDVVTKLGISSFKGLITIVIAVLLAPIFRSALKRAGISEVR